jgi:hypothetical protein
MSAQPSPLVKEAQTLAEAVGFTLSCEPEVGAHTFRVTPSRADRGISPSQESGPLLPQCEPTFLSRST